MQNRALPFCDSVAYRNYQQMRGQPGLVTPVVRQLQL